MLSMRVITRWALLALLPTLLAAMAQASLVVPPVQYLRPVVDTFPLAVASTSLQQALLPSGHHLLDRTRACLVAYHNNHRSRPGSMFRRLAAARLKHLHTSDSIRLDQKGVVYVIYNCRDDASGYTHDDRMYTHLSALRRFHSHISNAGSYLRRPSGGRSIFQKAHLMCRIWGSQGLKDYAVFPIEVCSYDPDTCSSKEFARRFKVREAFWINTLKTLETRGFNVRNERPVNRRPQGHVDCCLCRSTGRSGVSRVPGKTPAWLPSCSSSSVSRFSRCRHPAQK